MTLEELKAALDAAKVAFDANQKDTSLKAALDAAQKAYDDKVEADKGEPPPKKDPPEDDPKWDAETKAYIKKLRDESASHRTKNKELVSSVKTERERVKAILKAAGIEDESEKPEEKIKSLTAESQTKDFRLAVLEVALANGIPADEVDYLEYLVAKAAGSLGDGEELSDENIAEIVTNVKKHSKKPANTSVNGGNGKGEPPPGNSDDISLDKFCRMSITEKSALFVKDPKKYEELKTAAKAAKRLV